MTKPVENTFSLPSVNNDFLRVDSKPFISVLKRVHARLALPVREGKKLKAGNGIEVAFPEHPVRSAELILHPVSPSH